MLGCRLGHEKINMNGSLGMTDKRCMKPRTKTKPTVLGCTSASDHSPKLDKKRPF